MDHKYLTYFTLISDRSQDVMLNNISFIFIFTICSLHGEKKENSNILSKTDYQLYLKAPMHLWANKHDQIQKHPTEFEIHIMNQGYEVEELARNYLKEFIINSESVEYVQFQRTFSDKQLTARTDALVYKPETDSFDLYEIKSSSSIKPEFIIDVTFQ